MAYQRHFPCSNCWPEMARSHFFGLKLVRGLRPRSDLALSAGRAAGLLAPRIPGCRQGRLGQLFIVAVVCVCVCVLLSSSMLHCQAACCNMQGCWCMRVYRPWRCFGAYMPASICTGLPWLFAFERRWPCCMHVQLDQSVWGMPGRLWWCLHAAHCTCFERHVGSGSCVCACACVCSCLGGGLPHWVCFLPIWLGARDVSFSCGVLMCRHVQAMPSCIGWFAARYPRMAILMISWGSFLVQDYPMEVASDLTLALIHTYFSSNFYYPILCCQHTGTMPLVRTWLQPNRLQSCDFRLRAVVSCVCSVPNACLICQVHGQVHGRSVSPVATVSNGGGISQHK